MIRRLWSRYRSWRFCRRRPQLCARLQALMAGIEGEKSDADLEAEARIWHDAGYPHLAGILRAAKGTQGQLRPADPENPHGHRIAGVVVLRPAGGDTDRLPPSAAVRHPQSSLRREQPPDPFRVDL